MIGKEFFIRDVIKIVNRARGALPFVLMSILNNTTKMVVVTSNNSPEIVGIANTLSYLTSEPIAVLTENTVYKLTEYSHRVVIGNINLLKKKVNSFQDGKDLCVKSGQEYGFDRFISALLDAGYTRVESVFERGGFSVKGGIVDVYPHNAELPVRVEFTGDSIESISVHDSEGRSVGMLDELSITSVKRIEGGYPLYKLIDPNRVLYVLIDMDEDLIDTKAQKVFISSIEVGEDVVYTPFSPSPLEYAVDLDHMADLLRKKRKQGFKVFLCTTALQKVQEFLRERMLEWVELREIPLTEGFIDNSSTPPKLFVTERELFGHRILPRRSRVFRYFNSSLSKPIDRDLKDGEYVIHIDHGIGIYRGKKNISIEGSEKSYFVIEYADKDMLYVPEKQADRIQKYIGKEHPYVYRLSETKRWELVKRNSRKAIRKIAEDLVRLYAMRQMSQGYAFSPDTLWQGEFEDEFAYEETEDQKKAIMDVKHDMEKPVPMDRIICGEAGYGKTEIAVRAAFKAVMDHKQVAVVCPTTILAQQHYYTFRDRMKRFPVRIEILSRFSSPRVQREIIDVCKDGKVDIVIGTHRLLQKDVGFKDLGLVIVDEEQKFGVMQKEYLKKLKLNVDVLTITATPIPRTLYMSLVGIRDISVISTPPRERMPVKIEIGKFSKKRVKKIIETELARGGQVFYVHNSIEELYRIKAWLCRLFPDASISVAHGQMQPQELKEVLTALLSNGVDILIATTIVEDGLDVPFANTIIVDMVERLGISQLYQLVGRVGRRQTQGYAYLFHSDKRKLTEDAKRRLSAIEEFVETGSSFKLAMRDMEIRGIGNILGKEQHGLVMEIGLSLYTQILQEEIERMKNIKLHEEEMNRVAIY